MSCGCKSGLDIQSWNDFNNVEPKDPLDLISLATLVPTVGTWGLSTIYNKPTGASVWTPSPIVVTGENVVSNNGTDNVQLTSEANQWNFSHQTTNTSSLLAPPMRKIIFMRAGIGWTNTLPIDCSGSTFTDLMLSFAENATTRGDAQGTIPVISWSGSFSGAKSLALVLKQRGRFTLGLVGVDNNSTPNWSMFELDIVVV